MNPLLVKQDVAAVMPEVTTASKGPPHCWSEFSVREVPLCLPASAVGLLRGSQDIPLSLVGFWECALQVRGGCWQKALGGREGKAAFISLPALTRWLSFARVSQKWVSSPCMVRS